MNLVGAFGAAMTPVFFAYGGWQTSSFLGGEVRDPQRNLPRGLILGVLGVIAVYVSVNVVYLCSERNIWRIPPPRRRRSCADCSGRVAGS